MLIEISPRCTLFCGDCRDVLPTLVDLHACITDPPYELGFMGRSWDKAGVSFQKETWECVEWALRPGGHLLAFGGTRTHHRITSAIEDAGFEIRDQLAWVYGSGFPKSMDVSKAIATPAAQQWQGWGTALKPAFEPVCVARKPLDQKTVAQNVLTHSTGAINVDACRIEAEKRPLVLSDRRLAHNSYGPGLGGSRAAGITDTGRWPANFCHDGSEEVLALLGSAARFFYCAKASPTERGEGNNHPTVKPVAFMRWLCRMVTPPGGTVMDPFMGSGTTGIAALAEGFNFIGIERDPAYFEIACKRIAEIEQCRAA